MPKYWKKPSRDLQESRSKSLGINVKVEIRVLYKSRMFILKLLLSAYFWELNYDSKKTV